MLCCLNNQNCYLNNTTKTSPKLLRNKVKWFSSQDLKATLAHFSRLFGRYDVCTSIGVLPISTPTDPNLSSRKYVDQGEATAIWLQKSWWSEVSSVYLKL